LALVPGKEEPKKGLGKLFSIGGWRTKGRLIEGRAFHWSYFSRGKGLNYSLG